MRMNQPKFYRSKTGVEESVELAVYRIKDVEYDWMEMWGMSRGEDTAPMTWKLFQDTFMDKFFSLEMREVKIEEFMNLR